MASMQGAHRYVLLACEELYLCGAIVYVVQLEPPEQRASFRRQGHVVLDPCVN